MEGAGSGNPRVLNLALQGGGAHGAFTWGVLDRLLEDEGIPKTSTEILNRLNEISFNSSLMREMQESSS